MGLQPLNTGWLSECPPGAPHRIFTADFAHAQQGGIHAIRPNRRAVRIPMMSRENRKQDRPEDITWLWGIGTLVSQRTLPDPGSKQIRSFEKFNEEGQLAQGRHGRLRIPFNVNPAPVSVYGNRRGRTGGRRVS